MNKNIVPIFIFSLPRSGSTLLQRILASHPQITSVAEPWILLPFVYANKKDGIISEYNEVTCQTGITDFINNLPNKEDDYLKELSGFILNLYQKQASKKELFFIDKTPRYYYIIPEITRLFPNAKYIFLYRNPASILSSIIRTWNNNELRFCDSRIDVTLGSRLLVEGNKRNKNSIKIKYEELVQNPEKEINIIMDYLGLKNDKFIIEDFIKIDLKGRLGDPNQKKYENINSEMLAKWKSTFNSGFRKWFLIKYLNEISPKIIKEMGYDYEDICRQSKMIPNSNKRLPIDIFFYLYDSIYFHLKPYSIKKLLFNLKK